MIFMIKIAIYEPKYFFFRVLRAHKKFIISGTYIIFEKYELQFFFN